MKHNIFKNMLILASGSIGARLITLLTIPVLTRIYEPEYFGVLASFIALAALILPFSNLKYSTAIPLPKKDLLATHLILLCLALLGLVLLVVSIIFYFYGTYIFNVFALQSIASLWWLIPVSLFFNGTYEIFNLWATRNGLFKLLSKSLFLQSFIGTTIKIIFGLLSFKPIGLVIGHIITQAGGTLILIVSFLKTLKLHKNNISKQRIIFLFNYYNSFPKYKLPSHFLYTIAFQAPILLTSSLYGAERTGQLGLAFMALALPISIFGQTTSQAYYSEIAKLGYKQSKKIYIITNDITKKLFLISILPFLFLVFFAPWLFEMLFGAQWILAGNYTQALSVYLLAQFITTPIMQVFNVMNRQKDVLLIHLRRIFIVGVVFAIGYYLSLNLVTILLLYSISLSMHYFLIYFRVINILKKDRNE